ncbi:MAG: magnesium transporter [Pseudomonadota bacterium]
MEFQDDQRRLQDLRQRVPVDAALLLTREQPERVAKLLALLPRHFAVQVAAHLPEELRPAELATDAEKTESGTVANLTELTAGVLPLTHSVQQAIDWLRAQETAHDLTYLYVTDGAQRLCGLVVMRDLLLARPEQLLSEIMLKSPFTLSPEMSQSEAIQAAVRRHYPVYPVVDAQGKLTGIVRGYRLFEQQAIEISAQSGRMVGVNEEERVATSLWDAFRLRHPWLQINLLTAFLAGGVVSLFEDTITQIVALAAFLPILAGQSGNTGCQALAITLRGITLGDIDGYPVAKLITKEVTLGAVNGLFTGCVAGFAMWMFAGGFGNHQALQLGAVIALAMIGSCMASGFFGVMVPLTLRRFGADPSTASSIFLTTGTDIAGMGLMLFLATTLVL